MAMNPRKARFLFLISVAGLPLSLFGQGSLTPSGTPGPTMKSLDQIEARTPISSLPFVINSGGSYYLTKSLSVSSGNAITIAASGVTIDLNGFEITSTEASPSHSGILINSGLASIRIKNGSIRGNVTFNGSTFGGSGFANGIQTTGSTPTNAHVSDIAVAGCLSQGINLGGGLVESCTVNTIGGTGINADNVIYCEAYVCGTVCISAYSNVTGCNASGASTAFAAIQSGGMVTGCYASGFPSTSQATIAAQTARDCYAIANGGAGDALYANTAENCNGFAYGTGSGIHCYQAAINCYGTSSGTAAAVNVAGGTAQNCYGIAGSGTGISAVTAENSYGVSNNIGIVANSAVGCYGSNLVGTNPNISIGISALNATGCYGTSASGTGLQAKSAINSSGVTGGSSSNNVYGLSALSAQNCFGQSTASNEGIGIQAGIASFCYGEGTNNASGFGVYGSGVAYCSYGYPTVGGITRYFCAPNPTYP
jgi:hypothetical protein